MMLKSGNRTLISKNATTNSNLLHHQDLWLHKVKSQYVHFRLHANYFLLPWKIHNEVIRQPKLFNNLRQYLPSNIHTTFNMGVDWNWMFKWKYLLYVWYSTYCVFTLYGSNSVALSKTNNVIHTFTTHTLSPTKKPSAVLFISYKVCSLLSKSGTSTLV